MMKNEFNKFEPYTAFKSLVLLNIVKNDKCIISDNKGNNLGTLLANSIKEDIITFSTGTLNLNEKQEIMTTNKETVKNKMINLINDYGFNYDILKDDFLKNFDKAQAPKFYSITDYKYVPFVLMEYARNENFVKDVQVVINDGLLFSDIYCSIIDLLSFEIVVDISSLLDNLTTSSKKSSATRKARIKKYSDTQEKIYLYLKKWVKEYNSFGIDYYKLRNYVKNFTSDVSKALCELNKKYMVINNTKEKLIKFERSLDQYIINKAIV